VFDHHDLCPELYESRFPHGPRLPYRVLRALERRTHQTADHVISTNDSYREIAMTRGGRAEADVTVVRTGPDPEQLRRGPAHPELRRGHRFLAAYIGVMGPQDGVDNVVRAADVVVNELGRDDIAFTLIGSGDVFEDLVALRDELGLAGHVEFTGRAPDEVVTRILSTADVGLSPDPLNPLNDLSTMNKTMEYMAFELPVVAFDLRETRISSGEAGVYVQPNDVHKYAQAIVELMDDEPRRLKLGMLGRERVERELAWRHQERAYVDVYRRLISAGKRRRIIGNGKPGRVTGNGEADRAIRAAQPGQFVPGSQPSDAVQNGHPSDAVPNGQPHWGGGNGRVDQVIPNGQPSDAVQNGHSSDAVQNGHSSDAVQNGHSQHLARGSEPAEQSGG
jgi:glycosyltransferase involved in cell wall biosynthesis